MAPPSSIKMSASLEPLIYWLKVKKGGLFYKEKAWSLGLLRRLTKIRLVWETYDSAKPIKGILLEQKLVTWSLKISMLMRCFGRPRVHPETPAKELSKATMKQVHDQTIAILQLGIEKGGSTIGLIVMLTEDGAMQNYLRVYGRAQDSLCPRCASTIENQVRRRGYICVLIVRNDDYWVSRWYCFRKINGCWDA